MGASWGAGDATLSPEALDGGGHSLSKRRTVSGPRQTAVGPAAGSADTGRRCSPHPVFPVPESRVLAVVSGAGRLALGQGPLRAPAGLAPCPWCSRDAVRGGAAAGPGGDGRVALIRRPRPLLLARRSGTRATSWDRLCPLSDTFAQSDAVTGERQTRQERQRRTGRGARLPLCPAHAASQDGLGARDGHTDRWNWGHFPVMQTEKISLEVLGVVRKKVRERQGS